MIVRYQTHIEDIAKKLNCRLVQLPNLPGMMYVEFGYIEIPTIEDQKDYLIGLHELGHFHHGHTQGRPPKSDERFYFDNGVLKSEAQAWEYALDNSIDEWNEPSRRFAWDHCLGSYYQYAKLMGDKPFRLGNGNRHHIEFVYDRPDEYFTSIVKRIQGDLKGFKINYVG